MNKDKEKKKTLTISSNFKSKIDSTNFQKRENKKSYSINNEKKGQLKNYKKTLKPNFSETNTKQVDPRSKKFTRKFVEQQATKAFIKKEDKPTGKSKLKLKTPIDKLGKY